MDSKPQRPLRQLAPQVSRNENLSMNPAGNRSKNAGHQGNFPATGFKGPGKRSAFGDLSNTAGTTANHNVSAKGLAKYPSNTAKMVPYKNNDKENAIKVGKGKGKDAFLRPAQRPPTGLKPSSTVQGLSSQTNTHGAPIIKQTVAKKTALVYHDEQQQKPQTLSRQYRSQPYLKSAAEPALRRTHSKNFKHEESYDNVEDDIEEASYEDAMEELPREHEPYFPSEKPAPGSVAPVITADMEPLQPVTATTSLPWIFPSSLAPEAEEYSDEEYDEDLYDEQGYTTAHSIKSYGDNTGGATTLIVPKQTSKTQQELEEARLYVEKTRPKDDVEEEEWDVSMVAEYGEEIFEYMRELELKMIPNPHYMSEVQVEIQWSMRSILMDWLVQVHNRFTLLPETLFLTVNYIDRFLSSKMVSLGKLQLVGATAIFVAAKYEEINCPSVQEIVFMVDGGYTVEEILKAERFMLSMLQFELGWPGPMSFLRRISKADDYDLETRTLAKYFLEVTIMDERFVGCPPSYLAAGAHCLARLMLKKGDWVSDDPIYGHCIDAQKLKTLWSLGHIHYSGYTWAQIKPLVAMILECCRSPQKHHAAVYEKYADRRFKKASTFVEEVLGKGFMLPFHHSIPRLSLCSAANEDSAPIRYPLPELISTES
ncbi:G2/mitotic-specific cyclin-4 [Cytospora mali]|uniref:G2/mitotic-specific cyclin-4 n=1 Tax=Cytospora mali TaxID=578113 RepID=A0A194VBD4_CYTMA|nr:G2/mitotic-specific cyclin-4 [Valsa mali var. pyri (nom. inval.)]